MELVSMADTSIINDFAEKDWNFVFYIIIIIIIIIIPEEEKFFVPTQYSGAILLERYKYICWFGSNICMWRMYVKQLL